MRARFFMVASFAVALGAASLAETAEKVVSCSVCGAPDTRNPCAICSDGSRDNGLICVVEEAGALWAIWVQCTPNCQEHVCRTGYSHTLV